MDRNGRGTIKSTTTFSSSLYSNSNCMRVAACVFHDMFTLFLYPVERSILPTHWELPKRQQDQKVIETLFKITRLCSYGDGDNEAVRGGMNTCRCWLWGVLDGHRSRRLTVVEYLRRPRPHRSMMSWWQRQRHGASAMSTPIIQTPSQLRSI